MKPGIDVLLATSKHNVQYLLGGHRAFFFDYMDAMGLSRYLPVVIYPKGAPEKAGYIGARLERFQTAVRPLWMPEVQTTSNGSVDSIEKAVDTIRHLGLRLAASAPSCAFLPVDGGMVLRQRLPDERDRGSAARARAAARAQERVRAGDAQDRVRAGHRTRCRR